MRHALVAVGGLFVAFGAMAIVIAWANLYNVDYQPRRTLALIAGVGVVSVVLGVVLGTAKPARLEYATRGLAIVAAAKRSIEYVSSDTSEGTLP